MNHRNRVLGLLCAMALITYLDRICISVAGPRIQEELGIGPAEWGWVVGAFALAYGLFEAPSGWWGDRVGARGPLARIVAWWSVFTALTGTVSSLGPLVAVRFLFGVGEAGAFPIASASIARWFSAAERARAFGWIWMTSQLGGAAAPLLVVPLQMRFGWRASFFVFGAVGVVWSVAWLAWYRDKPAEERAGDWRGLLGCRSVWVLMGIGFCYVFGQYFFIAWLHTFLVKGRGFAETELYFTAAPFLLGAAANLGGGALGNRAVARWGVTWGRRAMGAGGLALSAVCFGAAALVEDKAAMLALLSASYAGTTLQQPSVWAACVDVGGRRAGLVSALMNTAAQAGSFTLAVTFGELAARWGYDVALAPVVAALAAGAGLWLLVDAGRLEEKAATE